MNHISVILKGNFDIAEYARLCVQASSEAERETVMQSCEQHMIAYLRHIKTEPALFPQKMQELLLQFRQGVEVLKTM